MIYDTTALINSIRKGSTFEEGSISVITLIEFLRGIEEDEKRKKAVALVKEAFTVFNVDEEVASGYVKLYFELKKRGQAASDADTLIAATAHAKNETLVTFDRDFLKFEPIVKIRLLK